MGRKKNVVTEQDGTPIEIDDESDITGFVQLDGSVTVENEIVIAVPDAPTIPPGARKVIWTATGELKGAFSEHGQHLADDEVVTLHADSLIRAGFAREASE